MAVPVEVECNRCLILALHVLWEVLSLKRAVVAVQEEALHNYNMKVALGHTRAHRKVWVNPSKSLVDRALNFCSANGMQADNINVVTVMFDEPGRRGAKMHYQSS
jgi:protein phosphatase 1D